MTTANTDQNNKPENPPAELETAKLFMTGRSQAVRLPKKYRFEGEEVIIKRLGNGVLLLPRNNQWANLLTAIYDHPDTTPLERDQGEQQKRDWGDF